MAERTILIVRIDNASVVAIVHERRQAMFSRLTEELLDLRVSELGQRPAGYAVPAFPLCCSIVLCSSCSCSDKKE
jgi:hypothetical protein